MKFKFREAIRLFLFFLTAIATGSAVAQTNFHPWTEPPLKLDATAYITNLKSGDKVVSPFVVKFGMRYWGIAPGAYKSDIARTGHFHLLIDTRLPSPIESPIPFNKNYIHFGKGQMETIVDLPPGQHTLRLLLANHDHVPYFVYSDLVTVTVTGKDAAALPENYGKVPHLDILNVKNGDTLIPPFLLEFHASGLNIAHAETKLRGTGYFQIKFQNEASPRSPEVTIPFPNGTTESRLNPPNGTYRIQLQFIENPDGKLSSVTSDPITIKVKNR